MSTEPTGYWQIESDIDLTQRDWHELRDGLERATLEGKTIAVINGITLTWKPVLPVDAVAEAIQQYREQLRSRIEGLPVRIHGTFDGGHDYIDRAAVLAELDK